jgi:hypothetical protein
MRHRGGIAAVGSLTMLLAWACGERRPVPKAPSAPAVVVDATPAPLSREPDVGTGGPAIMEAAPVPASVPAPVEVKWTLIDSGRTDKGDIQRCDTKARFASLASILARPEPGPVAVRGRLWIPASYPCSDGIPEACEAAPVLAQTRPVSKTTKQIYLVGYLAPNETLACTGEHKKLRCPIPFDGREYGVTGNLRNVGYDDVPSYQIQVLTLCRFTKGAGR